MDTFQSLVAPRPFAPIADATRKQIKERVSYMHSVILPHLQLSEKEHDRLLSYGAACQTLTEDDATKEECDEAKVTIAEYEDSLKSSSNEAPRLAFDLETKVKMGQELDNLWDMWMFTRYEQYLPEDILKEAKQHPTAQAEDPWHRAFWKPFHARLETEKDAFAKVASGQNAHNECPTHLLLALLCDRHTVDWDETLKLIKATAEEADVNFPGCDLAQLIKARDTAGLANRLEHDEGSVSLSSEFVMGVLALDLAYFALHLPDMFFVREEFDASEWEPTKELLELMDRQNANEGTFKEFMLQIFEKSLEESDGSDEEMDGEMDEDDDEAWDDEDEEDYEAALSDDSDDY